MPQPPQMYALLQVPARHYGLASLPPDTLPICPTEALGLRDKRPKSPGTPPLGGCAQDGTTVGSENHPTSREARPLKIRIINTEVPWGARPKPCLPFWGQDVRPCVTSSSRGQALFLHFTGTPHSTPVGIYCHCPRWLK